MKLVVGTPGIRVGDMKLGVETDGASVCVGKAGVGIIKSGCVAWDVAITEAGVGACVGVGIAEMLIGGAKVLEGAGVAGATGGAVDVEVGVGSASISISTSFCSLSCCFCCSRNCSSCCCCCCR